MPPIILKNNKRKNLSIFISKTDNPIKLELNHYNNLSNDDDEDYNSNLNLKKMIAKRKSYSFVEKFKIIEESKGSSRDEICSKYKLNPSVLHRWLKNSSKIESCASENYQGTLKKYRTVVNSDLEDILYTWFSETRSVSVPISGPMIKQKAKEIAKNLGVDNFKASDGWLFGWKNRKSIRPLTVPEIPIIVQYVIIRGDLLKTMGWPVGAVIAQACHASTAVTHLFYKDPHTQKYLSDLDNMHKIVLEAADEAKLNDLHSKLDEAKIDHKLWIEQPENIPTCLVCKPYPKGEISKFFKKFKLFK